jgi:CheY-like chemotaxis protein
MSLGRETEMPKILVADDMEEIVRLVEINLTRKGYAVITARDGQEALEKIKTDLPDLVISDVVMPRKDGFSLLKDVRSDPITQAIPFIFLTVKNQDADVWQGAEEGVDAFLNKPFKPQELLEAVERVFEERNPAPAPGVVNLG